MKIHLVNSIPKLLRSVFKWARDIASVTQRKSIKKVLLKILQNSQEISGVSFLLKSQAIGLQIYLKEIPVQVHFCEFLKVFKDIFFIEHIWKTASHTLQFLKKVYKLNRFCHRYEELTTLLFFIDTGCCSIPASSKCRLWSETILCYSR